MIEFDAIIPEDEEPVWEHAAIIAYLIKRKRRAIKTYRNMFNSSLSSGSKQHWAMLNYYQQEIALWDFLVKLIGTLDAGLKLPYGRSTISIIANECERDYKKPNRSS